MTREARIAERSARSWFSVRWCFRFRDLHSATGLIAIVGLSFLSLINATGGLPIVDPPWTTQKGLPESSVFSLLQTRDGYLWVGTGYGLARFDGIHFKTFDQNGASALSSGIIVKLFEDSRDQLWVGTKMAGIWIVDKEGKITSLHQAGKGPNAQLVTIIEDPSGSVWFSTATHGLFRYREGELTNLGNECNGLATDNSGYVWIGVRDNQGREKLIGLGPIATNPVPGFQYAYEIPINSLDYLLASRNGGYWRLANRQIQKWQKDRLERDFGSYPWNTAVLAVCEDAAGGLIVGTYGSGVYWFNSEGQFIRLDGLPSSYIYSLCMDREGSLWIGTDARGLNRVRKQVFDLESARGLVITSVCADQQGGLWVGINNGGVHYYQGDKMIRGFGEKEGHQGVDLYVRSVLADRAGRIWAGTISGRLFKLEGDVFKLVEVWPAVSTGVSVIFEDRQGRLWFGTEQGLFCREPEKSYSVRDGLSSNAIQALADDKAGNLWIGTQAGLNVLRSGQFASFHTTNGLPSEDISSLYVDEDDVLWVGTSSGLARFNGTNWTHYSKESGLISNPIGYITEDAEHFLWLGTMAGLVRVNKSDLNSFGRGAIRPVASRLYGVEDGLPDSQCFGGSSQPAAAVSKGKLWFPTIQGLVSVRPEQIHQNTNRPPVRIEDVKVQGVLQNTNSLRSGPPTAVTIRPNQEGLEINYASLNLAAPERARFRHRLGLLGHDAVWAEAGNVRVAQYPTLPPGEYRFEVTACNEDGIWNETPSRLAVTVLPPFWRKPWFITVVSLCLLGIVVSLVHYASTQRLQRQVGFLQQKEALEKERARIARDLHDQLGANLTQVALLGEMVETDKEVPDEVESHARQISSTARETTRALDEIVWTVNPSNDTLDGLINYVCKYAQEYLALAGLRYRLEVPSQLPAIPISPELRHNVFLAAKEAVNNVVKHSKATSAWLRLHLEAEQFTLEIEDDGRGLTQGDEKKGRSGLGNMRRRMEDINGRFEAGPGEQGGTRIRLVVPLLQTPSTLETPIESQKT
jgi:ligand-binding sensor domain-containing protein/signal transduction histidine kinase